jgi:DNA-binding transcriptional LysR family regulator
MKLSVLRNFIVIAQCGSLTRASEQLLISQPTLSRQVRELEEELGTSLFERSKEGLQLNEAGERLVTEASDIVERCDRLPSLFQTERQSESDKSVREVLRIGYHSFFNMGEVYQAAAALRKEAPKSEIMLLPDGVNELREGLLSNRYDVLFSMKAYYEDVPGLRILPFRENRFQLVVPADHHLAARERVSIGELRSEPFILLHRVHSPVTVDRIISLCVKNGYSPRAVAYVHSMEEGLRLAGAGQGITFFFSQMQMEGLAQRYHVRFLDFEDAEASVPLALVCKEKNQKQTLRRLIALLGL